MRLRAFEGSGTEREGERLTRCRTGRRAHTPRSPCSLIANLSPSPPSPHNTHNTSIASVLCGHLCSESLQESCPRCVRARVKCGVGMERELPSCRPCPPSLRQGDPSTSNSCGQGPSTGPASPLPLNEGFARASVVCKTKQNAVAPPPMPTARVARAPHSSCAPSPARDLSSAPLTTTTHTTTTPPKQKTQTTPTKHRPSS